MIAFDRPAALALAALPLAAALAARLSSRSGGLAALPLDVWGASPSGDAPGVWKIANRARMALAAAAWMSLSVAMAGPSSLAEAPAFAKSGLDIVFAVDVSPSMAALDLEPSRLGAAKALIRKYLAEPGGAAGASVGLVAFGREAALVCPPTPDYRTVALRLDELRPGALGDGTAIGQGLASALGQLVASGAPASAVVLLTDGEDNAGGVHPADVAAEFARRGTSLVVVGVGTSGDVPIDYVDPDSGLRMTGAYRSSYDGRYLSGVAAAAGGAFEPATGNAELSATLSRLAAIAPPPEIRAGRAGAGRTSSARLWIAASMAFAALSWAVAALALRGVA